MRKSALLLSVLLAVAASTTADAAAKKMHHHYRHHHRVAVEAPVNGQLSTMDQQLLFLHDAMFPFSAAKWW